MRLSTLRILSRRYFHRSNLALRVVAFFAAGILLLGGTALAQSDVDPLRAGFLNPPQTARPQVWWHWMSGNVNEQGAALDLAWMHRIGIGGVHIFSGSLMEPTVVPAPEPFMSDAWKQTFRSMTRKARDAGMEVTIAGSPGWSETGGTWVAPEDAMKKYVWSETEIEGGSHFIGLLKQPPSTTGPFQATKRKPNGHVALELDHDVYRDSVVIAFPTPKAAQSVVTPELTSNSPQFDPRLAESDGMPIPIQLASGVDGSPLFLQAKYPQSVSVYALTIGLSSPAEIEIQAEDMNGDLQTIARVPADRTESPDCSDHNFLSTNSNESDSSNSFACCSDASSGIAEGNDTRKT